MNLNGIEQLVYLDWFKPAIRTDVGYCIGFVATGGNVLQSLAEGMPLPVTLGKIKQMLPTLGQLMEIVPTVLILQQILSWKFLLDQLSSSSYTPVELEEEDDDVTDNRSAPALWKSYGVSAVFLFTPFLLDGGKKYCNSRNWTKASYILNKLNQGLNVLIKVHNILLNFYAIRHVYRRGDARSLLVYSSFIVINLHSNYLSLSKWRAGS